MRCAARRRCAHEQQQTRRSAAWCERATLAANKLVKRELFDALLPATRRPLAPVLVHVGACVGDGLPGCWSNVGPDGPDITPYCRCRQRGVQVDIAARSERQSDMSAEDWATAVRAQSCRTDESGPRHCLRSTARRDRKTLPPLLSLSVWENSTMPRTRPPLPSAPSSLSLKPAQRPLRTRGVVGIGGSRPLASHAGDTSDRTLALLPLLVLVVVAMLLGSVCSVDGAASARPRLSVRDDRVFVNGSLMVALPNTAVPLDVGAMLGELRTVVALVNSTLAALADRVSSIEAALALPQLSCLASPCRNGGSYVRVSPTQCTFMCVCLAGYTGLHCESDVDECASSPCMAAARSPNLGVGGPGRTAPEATCVQGPPGQYVCLCPAGMTGMQCQTEINECASSPCRIGSTCIDGPASFLCLCVPGYTGVLCQTELNECASSPCAFGSTCIDGIGSFVCVCRTGWTGLLCTVDVDECATNSSICSASVSVCLNTIGSYMCVQDGQCQNGGVFYLTIGCVCPLGWRGGLCAERVLTGCSESPCQNNGTCITPGAAGGSPPRYTCFCPVARMGPHCELRSATPRNLMWTPLGSVEGAVWDPSGRQVAVAGSTGYLAILNGSTLQPQPPIPVAVSNSAPALTALAWSPDGQWIAVAGADRFVRVVSVAAKTVVSVSTIFNAAVSDLAWGGVGGRQLAVATLGVVLYDMTPNGNLTGRRALDGVSGTVKSVVWLSPDWPDVLCLATLVSGSHSLLLYQNGIVSPLTQVATAVSGMSWAPKTRQIAISLTDPSSGGQLLTFSPSPSLGLSLGAPLLAPSLPCLAVSWDPRGESVAGAFGDMRIGGVWNASTPGSLRRSLSGHTGAVKTVAWSPLADLYSQQSQLLLTGGENGEVMGWRMPLGTQAASLRYGPMTLAADLSWSPTGAVLAVASGTLVRLYDSRSGNLTFNITLLTSSSLEIRSAQWSRDGQMLAYQAGGMIRVMNTTSWVQIKQASTSSQARAVSWSADSRYLAVGATVYDVSTTSLQTVFSFPFGGSASPLRCAWHPIQPRVALSAGFDGQVGLYQGPQWYSYWQVNIPSGASVSALAWDARSSDLAVVSHSMLLIVDASDQVTRWTLELGVLSGSSATAMSWSSNGLLLAVGFTDGTVLLYDVSDRSRLPVLNATLSAHTTSVQALAFHPDCRTLATLDGSQGVVKVWGL
jgi:WD40 repeat protein